MTMNEVWKKTNEEKVAKFICYLWERWQDEHEYEDINDYLKAIQSYIPEASKMMKRPFGFAAKCDDGDLKVCVRLKGNYLQFNAEMAA